MFGKNFSIAFLGLFVSAQAVSAAPFVRSDVTQDGTTDISDPVATLLYLFSEDHPSLECMDAGDANDSGAVDLGDVIYCLKYLFGDGPPPPAPFPGCGSDQKADDLTCRQFVSCGSGHGEYMQSDKSRNLKPGVSDKELSELVEGNAAFALNLYQEIKDGESNLFYSPYSISVALAMLYAGARSETERDMAEALHYTLPQERLHAAFNALDLELATRGEGAQGRDGEGFRLKIANALWGLQDYNFLPGFLDVLGENYGAGLRLLDFINSPEPSRITINDWISEQTEQRIPQLLPPGSITPLTRLVLTNAIYFNAAWASPFPVRATENGPFTLLNGKSATVPMMTQKAWFKITTGEGFKAVELPYDGKELSMVIVLPDEGELGSIEQSLAPEWIEEMLGSLSSRHVRLTMPRFRFRFKLPLNGPLGELGMGRAFSPGDADFSGINGKQNLFVHQVLHEAFVLVDEAGTEAAAATAVVVGITSAPPPPVPVVIDRPFIFFIRDIPTGAVLFVGRVVDPRG